MGVRDEAKRRLLAKAEELIDELLAWDQEKEKPTLTEIEDVVLRLRKELGEEMAEVVISLQERNRLVPGPACPKCGGEMRYKGQKANGVECRAGTLQAGEDTTTVRSAGRGFSPGSATGVEDRAWSEA